ncbi:hypothetical protein I7I50_12519 [Histoplasma capsulatum G186AR]|uniref:Uncharacterized protein n=1 Tax=Ajellomyces capsulatus TaxID=5037 RepID=A0A8H7YCH1_AJECA|nr:hypothetical protein I7I52_11174 [Histoplasma capsulatum]QSS70780.1 hypothetical protein I7I50_12519 [Histoplasma capsulatum G186AR]
MSDGVCWSFISLLANSSLGWTSEGEGDCYEDAENCAYCSQQGRHSGSSKFTISIGKISAFQP